MDSIYFKKTIFLNLEPEQDHCQGSINSVERQYCTDECDVVILVDAENAFNKLNRAAALQNIKQVCPSFRQYLRNSYKNPAKLSLNDGSYILLQEGVTQGDPDSSC